MVASDANSARGTRQPDQGPGRPRPDGPEPADRRPTERQVAYLADRTGLAAEELSELDLSELHERLRWFLDPELLLFRKVCGRVVRRDPDTGQLRPVPNATVHVEDTDCSLLFHAPFGAGLGYGWIYPGLCSTEEIATVETDECGNFCVWIPRWDIDRVLRWRYERVCFPELRPPRVVDVLDDLVPLPDPRRPADDLPDLTDPDLLAEVENRLGPGLAAELANRAPKRQFGSRAGGLTTLLRQPAPPEALPHPPVPDEEDLDPELFDDERLEQINLQDPIGPLWVCDGVVVPEWQTFVDVPDITFRVTQTQAAGEVTIYSEGLFDVRWDDTSDLSDVTLEVGPQAETVEVCGGPDVACEDEPAILNVATMPLTADYHDNSPGDPTFGYGVRVNQPSPDGVHAPSPGPGAGTAHAPYAGRLDLYGCFHLGDSTHYRVVRSFEDGPDKPITGVSFAVLTTALTVDMQSPDAEGWYEIRDDLASSYQHLILPWSTQQSRFPDGSQELVVQVGTESGGGISVDETSDPYTFQLDNARPTATFHHIRWWYDGDGPSTATELGPVCAVLERDPTRDVIVEVEWSASGGHLRDAAALLRGCGGGHPTPQGADATRQWRWDDPSDTTTGVRAATWRIPAGLDAGCYTAGLNAWSRAYNPVVDSHDWYVEDDRRRHRPRRSISVVDV